MSSSHFLVIACLLFVASANMNGRYTVASGSHQGVPYNDDFASKGYEYFDVYTPEIATQYSQVFWRDMNNHPLPPAILKRFVNKTIAIVGYEQDQVMVYPTGQPGVNPHLDVSVPINWAYNHHYGAYITGNKSSLTLVQNLDPLTHHGRSSMFMPKDSAPAPDLIPNSQCFSEGNGGESRKSYHGYAKPYAQLIYFPTLFHVTPMQIDTRNRECGATNASIHNCTEFTPGPEPLQARYGRGVPAGGTNASGLIECPCSSRYGGDPMFYPNASTKVVIHKFTVQGLLRCPKVHTVANAEECFLSIASLGLNATMATVSDKTLPYGCSVTGLQHQHVVFNTMAASNATCSNDTTRYGTQTVDPSVGTTLSVQLVGTKDGLDGVATITMLGPSDVWFGFGFNATMMSDLPWAIIVEVGDVIEHQLGMCGDEARHCPGNLLNASITVVSNTVNQATKTRTVVVTRPFKGPAPYYSFNVTTGATINFIAAVGSTPSLAYHRAHTPAVLTMTTVDNLPNCICDGGAAGELRGFNQTSKSFIKDCREDLIADQNPTCNTRSYSGGLQCCNDGKILLDADQTVPPELLRYHMKYRFWFQDYTLADPVTKTPASHINLDRIYMQTENAAGEYDIPPAFALPGLPVVGYPTWPLNTPTPGTTCTGQCPHGPDCECVHTLTYKWSWVDNITLIYAGGHCHAPACVSLTLYRNDTGYPEVICAALPVYGQGNVKHDKYDEAGYISIPPCLWGDENGLLPPPYLPANTPLVSVAINRNGGGPLTNGHFGQMASWQMRGKCGNCTGC